MSIRLFNAQILDPVTMKVLQGEVWVDGEKISYVGDGKDLDSSKHTWEEVIDCQGNLLMPGFKNAHTHSGMTFLRSIADDLPLHDWLNQKVFPSEAKLNGEHIYHFTKLAILEYLTSGVTAIFDMYLDPMMVAKACQEMGMRLTMVSGLNNFTSSIEQTAREYETFNQPGSLVQYHLGCHAEYTTSKDILMELKRLAHYYKAPVYSHMCETSFEVSGCQERYGQTPIAFLDSMDMFAYGGGGFHCIYVTDQEIEIMKAHDMSAVTCPGSNTKLASGIAPVKRLLDKGINVAIGTDGPASNNCLDMFREMFLVAGLAKLKDMDAVAIDGDVVLQMATLGGAKAMGLQDSNTISAGQNADMILIDLNQPNMQPIHNLTKNLVYSGSKQNIKMTMIAGKVLYRDGHFPRYDAKHIYEDVNRIVKDLGLH
ncbi:MAG: amidohydrolase [Lachnospiraceae bacterium]|nr:amidohydrolase [Lachnospiraceae bacterium]